MVPDPHTLIGEQGQGARLWDREAQRTAERLRAKDAYAGRDGYAEIYVPERCLGASGVDAKSDVWRPRLHDVRALVRPAAVCCRRPGTGAEHAPHAGARAAAQALPSVPVAVADLVHKLLRKDREQTEHSAHGQ